MYLTHFGIGKEPFGLTPDPSRLFLTESHREALAALSYAIRTRKGFMVLTGEAGTGKTTVLSRVIQVMSQQAVFGVILNSVLSPSEFLESVLLDFGLPTPQSKAQRLQVFERMLLDVHERGKRTALIVDEAHMLSPEVLEEVRLLSNFELPEGKLLQIVLAGQSELVSVLNRTDLRQLKQRIAIRATICPLAPEEVEEYIRCRWRIAGGESAPFAPECYERIAVMSRGIPRLVNSICDSSLAVAFAGGAPVVSLAHVAEAARDLDLAPAADANTKPVKTKAVEEPPEQGSPVGPILMPTLQRYAPASAQTFSRMRRFAVKLRLAQ